MPRGDFLGARNLGLPARSRDTPSAVAGVLDRGRRLHPSNTHPVLPHLAQTGTLGATVQVASGLSGPGARTKAGAIGRTASAQSAKSPLSVAFSIGSPMQGVAAAAKQKGTDWLHVDEEFSWEQGAPTADQVAPRTAFIKRATRHVDTGTPLGYSPAFEAYQFDIKDRWCTTSCVCLHQAAAADDERLCTAAMEGHLPFTRKHGLGETDDVGRTPVMVAAWRGALRALNVLLSGSDLDLADKDKRTVFHWAALSKEPLEVFQLLCDRNCETKTKDKLGDTCLHKMVLRGDVKTCQVLSRNDPRLVLVRNKQGKTPFDLAKTKALKDVVSMDRARQIIQEWEEKAQTAATELFEEQQKAAQQKKLQELEAMSSKKRSELVQNLGGSIKNIKMVGDERDDWDMFQRDGSEKLRRLAQLSESTTNVKPTIDWDEVDNEPVNFFTKIQFGDAAKGSRKGSQLNEHEAPQAAPVPSGSPPADQSEATANSPTAPSESARHL